MTQNDIILQTYISIFKKNSNNHLFQYLKKTQLINNNKHKKKLSKLKTIIPNNAFKF